VLKVGGIRSSRVSYVTCVTYKLFAVYAAFEDVSAVSQTGDVALLNRLLENHMNVDDQLSEMTRHDLSS
jgi:hypothetical protein